jgi:phenylacetate-CoA ligase
MTEPALPGREEIEARQFTLFRAMLEGLRPSNRFYTAKLADVDTLSINSLDQFFDRVPFTRKQELVEDQRANPPYGTNLTYPVERYTRFSQTSGTTGVPLRWLDTTETWGWMVDNWVQVLRASGVTAADRIFFAFSFGPFLGFWTAFEAGVRLGCMSMPGGGMSTSARLRVMLDNDVTVLCCTPTYAIRLGEAAAEEGIDLRQGAVRKIIVAGEPGAGIPATRAKIEGLWPGARLKDHHGMTEIGPVTFECPVHSRTLHIIEGSFIPEVIDPATGRQLGLGQAGELALTNLGRVGSPLIRYRTGDLVKRAVDEKCACGRSDMALEGGILGRTDDMVVVRGVNIHPTAVEEIVRAFPTVAEYRVELSTAGPMPELALQVEPVPGCEDSLGLSREIEGALRTAFNLRVPVTMVPCGSLPRFELKAKRWVRVDSDRA